MASSLGSKYAKSCKPDDEIVVIVSGAFGNRFKQIAETYYNNVHIFEVEWGKAVNVPDFIDFFEIFKY